MLLPTASVFGVVTQVAAVAVLIGVVLSLVRLARGQAGGADVTPLERAQQVALLVGLTGLAVRVFVESGIVDALFVAAVGAVVVLALVRRQRGEPLLPRSL